MTSSEKKEIERIVGNQKKAQEIIKALSKKGKSKKAKKGASKTETVDGITIELLKTKPSTLKQIVNHVANKKPDKYPKPVKVKELTTEELNKLSEEEVKKYNDTLKENSRREEVLQVLYNTTKRRVKSYLKSEKGITVLSNEKGEYYIKTKTVKKPVSKPDTEKPVSKIAV